MIVYDMIQIKCIVEMENTIQIQKVMTIVIVMTMNNS